MSKKLDRIFINSKKLNINNNSKIVIMSDCHRGIGNNHDNFLKNQNIYDAALNYYYKNGFTYIELGDGDDMWEVKDFKAIVTEHINSFKLLKKFYDDNKLIMVYGNHDMCKKSKDILKNVFYSYYDIETKKKVDLLNNLDVYESLILNYNNNDIFLIHGHQVELMNGIFWKLNRFLVRHIWRHLENFGIKDPTSAAKNYIVKNRVEKKLEKWSKKNDKILIAGHTHRPLFPKKGQSLYFNDGSCVHPNGISCLEIENGNITLIKWEYKLNNDQFISIGRTILDGSEKIISFFQK